jgi:hypothetical protein
VADEIPSRNRGEPAPDARQRGGSRSSDRGHLGSLAQHIVLGRARNVGVRISSGRLIASRQPQVFGL